MKYKVPMTNDNKKTRELQKSNSKSKSLSKKLPNMIGDRGFGSARIIMKLSFLNRIRIRKADQDLTLPYTVELKND
jgi:hypothetical protein